MFDLPSSLASVFSTSLLTFLLVFIAEMGDKSQIVCMSLAAKRRAKPVFFGAILAFMLLNLLAVLFGASLASVLPMKFIAGLAAFLFFVFAVQAWRAEDDEEEEGTVNASKSIFVSAFLLIFVAELGDKTQLAVATLGATQPPFLTWLSASLALMATTGIGVFAGAKWLSKLQGAWLNKISAALFLLFALMSLTLLVTL